MQNLNFRTPMVYYLIITITLIISFLSISFSAFANYGLVFAILLILFIGIPHGATDHLVFYSLSNNISRNSKLNFYLFYISFTLAYALFWYLFPSISLNVFIAISAYHLGQSNLYYLPLPSNKIIKSFIYYSWGLFIIAAAIISNPEQVNEITEYLSAKIWFLNIKNKSEFLALIIILNYLIISVVFILKYANRKDLFREYINLSVLGLLFYTTPLMISFGVYFGLWHSLGSTLEQIQFIKKSNSKLKLIDFYLKSIPLSIISLTIFMLTALCLANFHIQDLPKKINLTIACFFVFLAIITLPHTIIRDKFYKKYLSKNLT